MIPTRRVGFLVTMAVLLLASLLVAWHVLFSTLTLALSDAQYTHILLIIPVSLAFMWIERISVNRLARPSFGFGLPVLCAAVAIAVFARLQAASITFDVRLSIEMIALVTWWIGSFLLVYGMESFRVMLFPLGILFLLVPLPVSALNAIVSYLQYGSAFAAKTFFSIAGVPFIQDGLLLTIPGLTIEIAKECSSIRSSLMLLVTTIVLAQIYLRSPLKKILVIALAVPLSVAKNGLRIFTIAMLGTHVNPGFLHGRLHRQGGVVFFLVSLLIVFLLLWLLGKTEKAAMPRAAGVTA